jgi:putative transposase
VSEYRRVWRSGAVVFFTVNSASRGAEGPLVRNIDVLRSAFKKVMNDWPFKINAMVVLPDHLHCIWTLPNDDHDYSLRWRLIKGNFSRMLPTENEPLSESRRKRGERSIWQRRYWEHHIRDEQDYRRHIDYIHYNPVKHGYCKSARDWRHSSFERYVEAGIYDPDWYQSDCKLSNFGE